jgi:hypothetical protein
LNAAQFRRVSNASGILIVRGGTKMLQEREVERRPQQISPDRIAQELFYVGSNPSALFVQVALCK